MSRSNYSDDCDTIWLYRNSVDQALRGKRGQAFLLEMAKALDTMSEKKLIAGDLELDGAVCAIGSVGAQRGIDMSNINPNDRYQVAKAFGIAPCMAAEISYENDEAYYQAAEETPEKRWQRMRNWVAENLVERVG